MKNECDHNYEVKRDSLMTVCFVCKRCGAIKHLRRKYACLLYLLGLTGWIPSFFIISFDISTLCKSLISITIYLMMNFVLCFLFYKWLTTKKKARLSKFMSDQDYFNGRIFVSFPPHTCGGNFFELYYVFMLPLCLPTPAGRPAEPAPTAAPIPESRSTSTSAATASTSP